jgi:hypothetical protein
VEVLSIILPPKRTAIIPIRNADMEKMSDFFIVWLLLMNQNNKKLLVGLFFV